MNIINKLTYRDLKINRKRTLVTIAGIIISVAMIMAVTTTASSFIQMFIDWEIEDSGNWHSVFNNVEGKNIDIIDDDDKVETSYIIKPMGYSKLADPQEEKKPYLYIVGVDKDAMENHNFSLSQGRFPENDSEIVISKKVNSNSSDNYKIGDTIEVELGNRYAYDEDVKCELGQYNFYEGDFNENDKSGELFEATSEKKTYTIVGISENTDYDSYTAPGASCLVYLDDKSIKADEQYNVFVTYKDVKADIKYGRELTKKVGISGEDYAEHSYLLMYYGSTSDENFNSTMDLMVFLLIAIIMLGAISLIYNAFAISISERSKYLGMIASVGATKRQKRKSVFFEGFLMGIISIPLGIIAGIGGMWVTFKLISPMLEEMLNTRSVTLDIKLEPKYLIMTLVFSILTIAISSYIPARRASKISPIDAIRQTNDIKIKAKNVKNMKIVKKLFGFEGDIALKNLKRNKKRYRATVASLCISMILFLAVSAFAYYITSAYDVAVRDYNFDIYVYGDMLIEDNRFDEVKRINSIDSVCRQTEINSFDTVFTEPEYVYNNFTDKYIDEFVSKFKESGYSDEEATNILKDYNSVSIVAYDDEYFDKFAKENNIDVNANDNNMLNGIVVNMSKIRDSYATKQIFYLEEEKNRRIDISINDYDYTDDDEQEIKSSVLMPVNITGYTSECPSGLINRESIDSRMYIILSESQLFSFLEKNVETGKDCLSTMIYIIAEDDEKVLDELGEITNNGEYEGCHYYSIKETARQMKTLGNVMSIFAYGFIGLITLVCVANIFNTISTSINLRRREFGMLRSVGMTPHSFNKMIIFESGFYGIKALLFGLPISIGLMYLIYKSLDGIVTTEFSLPINSIIIAIVFVFIVVGSAMLYSVRKVKKENLIDTIR